MKSDEAEKWSRVLGVFRGRRPVVSDCDCPTVEAGAERPEGENAAEEERHRARKMVTLELAVMVYTEILVSPQE